MFRAWYIDEGCGSVERNQPMHHDPPQFVDIEQLKKLTGVLYWKINLDDPGETLLEQIKRDRGYSYEDNVEISREKLPNFDAKVEDFYREHIHDDEEIRLIRDGSGYFDVRDVNDRWIRMHVTKGDLVVLPVGIYHRFTLDTNQYAFATRYFIGVPVWTPFFRPCDDHDARKRYVERKNKQFED